MTIKTRPSAEAFIVHRKLERNTQSRADFDASGVRRRLPGRFGTEERSRAWRWVTVSSTDQTRWGFGGSGESAPLPVGRL